MPNVEQTVADHYAHGALERSILDALGKAGKDIDQLTPVDLAPVDEFHIGGRQATADFAARLDFAPGAHLLDVGSGLGGASRYFAHEKGFRVSGIDLTDEYVRVAAALARRVGLAGMVDYRQGSALDLPFAAATFDGAYMFHVGMNIEDKARLFAGVRRVLKPGAVFGIYDVMRDADGALAFPVPWSSGPATSFVETAATYRRLLEAAGFDVLKQRSRRDFALQFFQEARARSAAAGPPVLGLHVVMGPTALQKLRNMVAAVEGVLVAPTEMIARAV